MSARSAAAQVLTLEEVDVDLNFEAEREAPRVLLRPELAFDFSGQRHRASRAKAQPAEISTIKEAIVRWLEEQL